MTDENKDDAMPSGEANSSPAADEPNEKATPANDAISPDVAKLALRKVKDPELGLNIVDLGRVAAGDRLEAVTRAKHAWIQVQTRCCLVAHSSQRRYPRIEIGIALPTNRLRKARQIRIGEVDTTLDRLKDVGRRAVEER